MKFKKTLFAFATGITLLLNILNLTGITGNSSNTDGESNNYSISICSDDATYEETVKK